AQDLIDSAKLEEEKVRRDVRCAARQLADLEHHVRHHQAGDQDEQNDDQENDHPPAANRTSEPPPRNHLPQLRAGPPRPAVLAIPEIMNAHDAPTACRKAASSVRRSASICRTCTPLATAARKIT